MITRLSLFVVAVALFAILVSEGGQASAHGYKLCKKQVYFSGRHIGIADLWHNSDGTWGKGFTKHGDTWNLKYRWWGVTLIVYSGGDSAKLKFRVTRTNTSTGEKSTKKYSLSCKAH